MGLKAVALYRDGTKILQPLSFSEKDGLEEKVKPVRRKLPTTRDSRTHKYNIAGHEGYLSVGKFEDGTPGELFLTMHKEGSSIRGLMDSIGILTSISLQYGGPLEDLIRKFRHQKI